MRGRPRANPGTRYPRAMDLVAPLPISRDDLERRFDGPIPRQLLANKTERDLMIDHHRAMIRFGGVRIADFTESLTRLKRARPSPGLDAWIARTEAIIREHERDRHRHEMDLAALLTARADQE